MTPQEPEVMQEVRILKNPRLRKIRHKLRTLLFFLFELKKKELYLKEGEVRASVSLSYDGKSERLKRLLKERENLILSFIQRPINCSLCGSREEDLVYRTDDHMWVCYNRRGCHQRIEENAQNFRKMLKERLGN